MDECEQYGLPHGNDTLQLCEYDKSNGVNVGADGLRQSRVSSHESHSLAVIDQHRGAMCRGS